MKLAPTVFVLGLLVLVTSFTSGFDGASATLASDTKAPAALGRVVVVGASVSAGFGLDPRADPFQGQTSRLKLAQIVDASIVGAHAAPLDESDLLFFSAAKATAKRLAKEAGAAKPTLVVALDYLFWLGYGAGDEKERIGRLEDGLKALEGVKGTVLLGDLPDFNGAKVDRLMLPPESIPPSAVIARLNEKCANWAKRRKNVVLVPVASLFSKLTKGEAFTVRGQEFDASAQRRLMQSDGLHTTLEGTCALWVLAVDAWLATQPAGLDETAFELDVAELARKSGAVLGGGAGASESKVRRSFAGAGR
ncbi:MAG: hypothetical protein L6Q99_03435 [Planctomycetes bacterium]|nr:hypothetical protein [Planctomycetota bacterium]